MSQFGQQRKQNFGIPAKRLGSICSAKQLLQFVLYSVPGYVFQKSSGVHGRLQGFRFYCNPA